ncbi:MAG: DUF4450 domain-containing protein [Muribaculaceae bacterium]|uniref:DUF4450 domain-containing protein n=1 Tax=uncultured Duncaniella sp. TaxID=2768039 RepID=UPI001A35224B|nr:DUF4450 domain-containing protein [uncultured Duncaniella sp.]MBJ2190490.1 DUF4450 domain-containing protein [Muribaculaceae bacterium]
MKLTINFKQILTSAILLAATGYVAARSEMRPSHYVADGNSAITVNGQAKFNRALYGAHSGFRIDCSDTPEFGIYLPRMGGNLCLTLPEGKCTARYTPGRMDYEQGGVKVEAQVMRSEDMALWAITNTTNKTASIPVRFGGVADKKFYREGDLGVDDPTCFDLKPEYCTGNVYTVKGDKINIEYGKKQRSTLTLVIPAKSYKITDLPSYEGTLSIKPGKKVYLALFPASDAPKASLESLFKKAENEREQLASSVTFKTPDEWLNPIGGALAVAADGIWSGQAWLHGSIGWRTPHLGWRGAYVGNAVGRHDRALTHLNTYASNQITDIPAVLSHPRQDSVLNLARAEKKWGTPMYSNGYICRRPRKKDEMSHYDMNLVYIDAMLRHFRHTGDKEAMQSLFPVIKRHLEWEKLNFDPDGDHLYDAYCCIWASDALYYSGGAVTHSSAYNMFANRLAAQVAEAIGENPEPYRREAEAIAEAIDSNLWMSDRGHWAEYRDAGGKQRLHPSPAVWTIYHAIDSEIADKFKNYAATCYIDREIPHIPVEGEGVDSGLYTISTTNWKPYSWSINNVAIAEVMHTALAYWQAGRSDEAYKLMKAVAMDNMYLGASPLNFGQISHYDAARGECYRDFADPIGVWSRALTEGLFGVRPDLLAKNPAVALIPGFPSEWNEASVTLPDISYSFKRDGRRSVYKINNRYGKNSSLKLTIPAKGIKSVKVNGSETAWDAETDAIGSPRITVNGGTATDLTIEIIEADSFTPSPTGRLHTEGPVTFREMNAGNLSWWMPEVNALSPSVAVPANGFNDIRNGLCEPIDLTASYNASVTDIFRNEYLSPRPNVTTLQLPKQGIGEWCHPKLTAEIDDSGLRSRLAKDSGILKTESGIPFALPAEGSNILFTSLWDNYPDSAKISLSGRASHLYLLMAGSTNHMQWGMENGRLRVRYTDGTESVTPLINPHNWAPIELDFYHDDYAFAQAPGALPPYRLHLKTGRMSRTLGAELGIKGVGDRFIEGGAGIVLDMPVDSSRELSSLSLETLSGDVVIGLMGLTIQRAE